jgi:hypothetical protein
MTAVKRKVVYVCEFVLTVEDEGFSVHESQAPGLFTKSVPGSVLQGAAVVRAADRAKPAIKENCLSARVLRARLNCRNAQLLHSF